MGLFDDFSRMLNSAGRAISEAGAGVSHKTQDFAEIAKFGTQIQEQESLKKAALEELGRKYYEIAADNEEAEGRDLIVKIRAIDGKIRVLKDKVCALKGTRECPSCHHLNPLEAVYCNQCGAKLAEVSEDPEDEDIFEEEDVLEAEYVTVKAAPASEKEPVERAAEAVGKTWENISEKTDEAVNKAADAAGEAARKLEADTDNAVERAAQAAGNAAEKLEAGADAAVDKAANAAGEAAKKLEAGADAAVDKAAQAAADAAEKLEAGADEAVDRAAHFAEDTAKKAEEAAADSVEKAAQFADEAVRKAMQYADEAAEKALQFAEKLRDEAKNRFGN